MSLDVPRPCDAARLVALAPPFVGGWGTPLDFDLVNWELSGRWLGFDDPFSVEDDSDWDSVRFERQPGLAVRFVVVPIADGWMLRAGRPQPDAVDAKVGGMHRHMFSSAEARAARQAEQPIGAGWIYEITAGHVTIG